MATNRETLEAQMHAAAAAGDYERAAKLRDELRALSADPSEIHAQVPGAMGIGTQHPQATAAQRLEAPKGPTR